MKILETMRQNTIIYFDMDGVLAKWQEVSEEETHKRGYFASREAEQTAIDLLKLLKSNGFDVRILSSVYIDDHSLKEKKEWLEKNEIGVRAVFVPYGEDKYEFIEQSDKLQILIDDFGKNLNSWEENGHLPVKFMNNVNSRPKMLVSSDGSISLKPDSWTKDRLDYRMTLEQMYSTLIGVIGSRFIAA